MALNARQIAEREILCSASDHYRDLISPMDDGNTEKNKVKTLLRGVHSDTYSSTLYNPEYLSHHRIHRTTVIKTLAISLVDEKTVNRINAVWGLTSIRAVPQARSLMEDIAQHYPIQAIREKAFQMLYAPEISAGCFLLGAEDMFKDMLKDPFAT